MADGTFCGLHVQPAGTTEQERSDERQGRWGRADVKMGSSPTGWGRARSCCPNNISGAPTSTSDALLRSILQFAREEDLQLSDERRGDPH
jgi:hypothetical protein